MVNGPKILKKMAEDVHADPENAPTSPFLEQNSHTKIKIQTLGYIGHISFFVRGYLDRKLQRRGLRLLGGVAPPRRRAVP